MARVSIPTNDDVSDEIRAAFQYFESTGVPVLNVNRVMAHSPKIGFEMMKAMVEFYRSGSLPPNLRELAILRVGDLAQANYEWTQHVPAGLSAGLTQEQIDAIHDWNTSDLFDNQERAVLQYTDEVAKDIRVADDTFQEVKDLFTEEQVVELTMLIGLYGLVARFLEALQIELETGTTREANADLRARAKDLFEAAGNE